MCAFALGAACGESEAPGFSLEIGAGEEDGGPGFLPLEAGAQLALVAGPQGGFHVYMNLRVQGDDAAVAFGPNPIVRRAARRSSDGALIQRATRREPFIETVGGFDTSPSLLVILCPTPPGVPIADQTIALDVSVSPPDGGPGVSARAEFVPVCRENTDFCAALCFG